MPWQPMDPARVRAIFASIVPRYDLMNTVMTFGTHKVLKRLMARIAVQGSRVSGLALDVGCGTGDVALYLLKRNRTLRVVGVDPVRPMLERAVQKAQRAGVAQRFMPLLGDGMALPFSDGVFGACACAFVLRNTADPLAVLREMKRVLAPGGYLVVLELCGHESSIAERVFGFYVRRVVPLLGRLVTGNPEAYAYLAFSTEGFPTPRGLARWVQEIGVGPVRLWQPSPSIALIWARRMEGAT
ncbi:MAG: ubiquinone/menaquinone biosynthesis methyltransferase [Dehalococcoidia bacterium]|nr:ubiquinone/menaquinone biosynthesis methyltransferase [Dehalococcoidia bacterium]MDW8119201.1 ubiquinone/menaquinone biosynthesis methyltransferase [Chloroflexota bacterium]